MKSQLKSFWFATSALGLLAIASAWVIGQETDSNSDNNTQMLSETEDAEHDTEAGNEENWDDEWEAEQGEWQSGWDEDSENEDFDDEDPRDRERFRGEEDEFDDDEFERDLENEGEEFGYESEDEWGPEFDEEDYLEDDWNEDYEDESWSSRHHGTVEDLERWTALGEIAANSEKTAQVAVQIAGAYLETEQAIELLEDTIETSGNSAVKRLAKLQLVKIYAQQEQPERMQEQLRRLILDH